MRSQLLALAGLIKSLSGLNNLLRYNPFFYPAIAATVRTIEQTSAADRHRAVQPLLDRTIEAALRTPYGKGRGRVLSEWPILRKEMVRETPGDFHTSQWIAIPASTSGSSGTPLRLRRSLKNIAAEQAFLDTLLAPQALQFRNARVAVLRGDTVKDPASQSPPFGTYRHRKQLVLSFPHLNQATAGWYIDELLKFQPEVFWVYPTGADFLASLCLLNHRKLSIPITLSSSEMLTPAAWSRIKEAFGGDIVDYYGQAERVCLSYQRHPDEAWFHPAYGFVELFPSDEPADEDQRRAKIIATGYWKDKMPLVRYDTGDYIAYPAHYSEADLAQVALGLKPFTRIIGRESEFLLTPNGERIQALNNIPKEVKHLRRAQFIQHHLERVEIRLDVEPRFSDEDQQQLVESARTKIPPTIHLTITTDQPLTVTESGKTPFVIRTVSA